MRKIRLGIFLEDKIFAGGGYQQALNAALLVKNLPSDICDILFFTTVPGNIPVLNAIGIKACLFPLNWFKFHILEIRRQLKWPLVYKWFIRLFGDNSIERFLEANRIDLVYFLSPSELSMSLEKTNYIMTVWDLSHRDDPEFPEVRNGRLFEARERLYNASLPKAVAVIVDSDIGKANVVRHYSIDPNRVHAIPFSPAVGVESHIRQQNEFVDIKSKYSIESDYIFYPAQFWAHKNHVYLIRSLKILEEQYGLKISCVFSGGDAGGNLDYIKKLVFEYGLKDRVKFIGFVENSEIPYLYEQSIALVMPTYFGPTNIPPLEAFSLGVPVLYSDLDGLRNQVGNAALLLDLDSPENCAMQLHKLVTCNGVRQNLIREGKQMLEKLDKVDGSKILISIIKKFESKRWCWK